MLKEEVKLPQAFSDRMEKRLDNEAGVFFHSLEQEPVISVRYNPLKQEMPASLGAVPWCKTGFYLDQRPVFTFDPAFHAGCYYVQEASSMFLEQAIVQSGLSEKKILALDLCAAPGGKTTHLASLLHPDSLIVSNETIHTRIPPLKENVIKWGSGNVLITQNDPADFSSLESLFDLVVIDAPCSGEGLFRKDSESREQWSEENCMLCSSRQKRILNEILSCLKPGGVIVYSTCTYNENENEENIRWMSEKFATKSLRIDLTGFESIKEIYDNGNYSYVFYPHKVRGEGFFLSVLRKPGTSDSKISFKDRKSIYQPLPSANNDLRSWIISGKGIELYKRGDFIFALQKEWKDTIEFLCEALHVKHSGIPVAELKGAKAIPHHALAMSSVINRDIFPAAELSETQAMDYLRREVLSISSGQKGWMLATWNNKILGWINHLGNRTNNYYPVEWRVRKRQ